MDRPFSFCFPASRRIRTLDRCPSLGTTASSDAAQHPGVGARHAAPSSWRRTAWRRLPVGPSTPRSIPGTTRRRDSQRIRQPTSSFNEGAACCAPTPDRWTRSRASAPQKDESDHGGDCGHGGVLASFRPPCPRCPPWLNLRPCPPPRSFLPAASVVRRDREELAAIAGACGGAFVGLTLRASASGRGNLPVDRGRRFR